MSEEPRLTERTTGTEGEENDKADDKAVRSYGMVIWSKLTGNIEAFIRPCSLPELQIEAQKYADALPPDVVANLDGELVSPEVWIRMQRYTMERWAMHQPTLFHLLYEGVMRDVGRGKAEKWMWETGTYYKKQWGKKDKEEKDDDSQFVSLFRRG